MPISWNLCITRWYQYIDVNYTRVSIDRLVVHRYTL